MHCCVDHLGLIVDEPLCLFQRVLFERASDWLVTRDQITNGSCPSGLISLHNGSHPSPRLIAILHRDDAKRSTEPDMPLIPAVCHLALKGDQISPSHALRLNVCTPGTILSKLSRTMASTSPRVKCPCRMKFDSWLGLQREGLRTGRRLCPLVSCRTLLTTSVSNASTFVKR